MTNETNAAVRAALVEVCRKTVNAPRVLKFSF